MISCGQQVPSSVFSTRLRTRLASKQNFRATKNLFCAFSQRKKEQKRQKESNELSAETKRHRVCACMHFSFRWFALRFRSSFQPVSEQFFFLCETCESSVNDISGSPSISRAENVSVDVVARLWCSEPSLHCVHLIFVLTQMQWLTQRTRSRRVDRETKMERVRERELRLEWWAESCYQHEHENLSPRFA